MKTWSSHVTSGQIKSKQIKILNIKHRKRTKLIWAISMTMPTPLQWRLMKLTLFVEIAYHFIKRKAFLPFCCQSSDLIYIGMSFDACLNCIPKCQLIQMKKSENLKTLYVHFNIGHRINTFAAYLYFFFFRNR